MPLAGAQCAHPLPVPRFGAPVARRIAGRLVERRRGPLGLKSSRHRNQFSRRPERRSLRIDRHWRRQQPRGRFDFHMIRTRSQAGIRGHGARLRVVFVRSRLHTHRHGPCHEVVHQLVQAGLSAQMLRPWTRPVARVPAAYAQFPTLVIGHKPVVRLLLFRSADVARYRLPDHRISPSPHSLSRLRRFRSTPSGFVRRADSKPSRPRANPIGDFSE